MAAKSVDIKINTTASGNGAKQTAADMDKLAAELQGAEHAFEEFNQASAKGEEQLRQTAEQAKLAAEAQAKAAEHMAQQERDVLKLREKGTQAINTQASSIKGLGARAGAVGLQLQDIAVQAQMGTSAVTILAQQGTQIASIFGPQGAIVGALIGVGAVAAKVFYDMAKSSAVTGEAMEDMSDKLKEAFSDNAKMMVEKFNAELENQTTYAQSLRDMEVDLMQARLERGNADAKLIESQSELETAAIRYLDATGQIINAEKALEAIRNKAATEQRDAQVAEIQNQVEVARARYVAFTKQYEDVQAATDRASKRLSELEAEQQRVMSELTFKQTQDKRLQGAGVLKQGEPSQDTRVLQNELDSLRKQIDGVYNVLKNGPGRLQNITQQSIEAATQLDIAIIGAETQIATINEQFNLTQSAQALTTATKSITEGAKQIQSTVSEIEAVGPVQEQAKAVILKAVEDGKITAQEQVQIGQNLAVLMGTMRGSQTEQIKAIQDLINLNNTMQTQMQAMQRQIDQISEKRKSPTGIQ